AIREGKGVPVRECGAPHDELGPGRFEVADIGLAEPVYLLVLVGDQSRPVERDLFGRPAEVDRILEGFRIVARIDEKFIRPPHANDAGAADTISLGNRDLGAVLGGDARRTDAARPAADDEKIVVVSRHRSIVSMPRSPAMMARDAMPMNRP